MQMNDQNKLTIKIKERAQQLNELTKELVAASLFDSNLFSLISGRLPLPLDFPIHGPKGSFTEPYVPL